MQILLFKNYEQEKEILLTQNSLVKRTVIPDDSSKDYVLLVKAASVFISMLFLKILKGFPEERKINGTFTA